jgi:hypothetical protein
MNAVHVGMPIDNDIYLHTSYEHVPLASSLSPSEASRLMAAFQERYEFRLKWHKNATFRARS